MSDGLEMNLVIVIVIATAIVTGGTTRLPLAGLTESTTGLAMGLDMADFVPFSSCVTSAFLRYVFPSSMFLFRDFCFGEIILCFLLLESLGLKPVLFFFSLSIALVSPKSAFFDSPLFLGRISPFASNL